MASAGEVVHVEFPSQDADRAQRFWSGLFGWSFAAGEPGMDYRMAQVSDSLGAAVYPSEVRVGQPAYYFNTDDIQASIARVRELGGEAEERSPVPGHGWFAACRDSEGNPFHLWQADSSAA
jgi:predicted enzyme related to lactoylglutathione lyase